MGEEPAQTAAQVVEPGFAVKCCDTPVLGTAAVAQVEPRAGAALCGEASPLVFTEAIMNALKNMKTIFGNTLNLAVNGFDDRTSHAYKYPLCVFR